MKVLTNAGIAACLVVSAAASPAPSEPVKPDPLKTAEQKLATAQDSKTARAAEQEAERLRERKVTPAAQLLMRDAQHALEGHDLKTAIASLDDALVLQPDPSVLWRARGQARADAGDYAGAIADFANATDRDPCDIEAWKALSDAEAERHHAAAALGAYEQVLRCDPLVADGLKHRDRLRIARDGQPI